MAVDRPEDQQNAGTEAHHREPDAGVLIRSIALIQEMHRAQKEFRVTVSEHGKFENTVLSASATTRPAPWRRCAARTNSPKSLSGGVRSPKKLGLE
jgi:hypothetical protein